MSEKPESEAERRRARLAAELRENLKRRKAQQRGRKDPDDRPSEPEPGESEPPTSAR